MCSEDKIALHNEIYATSPISAATTPAQVAAAKAVKLLEDTAVVATGSAHGFNDFMANLAAVSGSVSDSLESEHAKLNLSDINMKSNKHIPSTDTGKIKLGRVISSLLPELEGLDADIYYVNDITKNSELNKHYHPEVVSTDDEQLNYNTFMKSMGEDPTKLRFRNVNILGIKNQVESLEKPSIRDISTAQSSDKEKLAL
mmetsp:Transcript_36066/g.30360  ORF Transcript_36066/g.30360 Transcript_36066/m.30360 type:complete len:200 (-) Transcript_36066:556-1155(-)